MWNKIFISSLSSCQEYSLFYTKINLQIQRCDNNGVALLIAEYGLVYSDPANILIKQFTSIFTKESSEHITDLGTSPHPPMADITVQVGGVTKLLKNINPHKAFGPDNNSASFMNQTASETAKYTAR